MKLPRQKYYVLDVNHRVRPVSLMTWAKWFENTTNRIVDFTQVTSAVHVSTVFLGIDHRYWGEGPPVVFETMVFGGELDQAQWRYTSWDDAEAGHKAAVRKVRAAIKQGVKP